MADPTIQTFCCHHGNATDMAIMIMEEFNTDTYNAVCLFSSTLGILGAIYQILPRHQFSYSHRWLSFSATRGRKIIRWLAVADLLASLGVFIRSSLWINFKNIMPATDDDSSVIFCALSSAWTQYFYTATWIWTLCYAIDMRFILCEKDTNSKYYHLAAWVLPALTTALGLSLLYLPDANCHNTKSFTTATLRILPNYFATYIPITLVMIANPCLYHHSTRDMERIITGISGQFTSREREIIDAIKIKFSVINIVFYVCWVPNLLNGVLLWVLWFHLPVKCIITIWYIMALMNPLQAIFNTIVYRRWTSGSEKVLVPWKDNKYLAVETMKDQIEPFAASPDYNFRRTTSGESYPLLQKSPPISSVNYHTYSY